MLTQIPSQVVRSNSWVNSISEQTEQREGRISWRCSLNLFLGIETGDLAADRDKDASRIVCGGNTRAIP
jgi:hypothetical protein